MQRLEVSGAVRPLYGSLGVKGLNSLLHVTLYEDTMLLTVPPLLLTVETGLLLHSVSAGVSFP